MITRQASTNEELHVVVRSIIKSYKIRHVILFRSQVVLGQMLRMRPSEAYMAQSIVSQDRKPLRQIEMLRGSNNTCRVTFGPHGFCALECSETIGVCEQLRQAAGSPLRSVFRPGHLVHCDHECNQPEPSPRELVCRDVFVSLLIRNASALYFLSGDGFLCSPTLSCP